MASVSYRCTGLYHGVFQPEIILETHYFPPWSFQIEVTIFVDLLIAHHDYLTGLFIGYSNDFTREALRFNLHVLKDQFQAYEILRAMLTRLKIKPAWFNFDNIVVDIMLHGHRNKNCASNRGRMILPLRAGIWGMVEQHENNEMVLMRRAIEDSALATNYGMVPMEESSVKKMLKKVKVKVKGEDCASCLEETMVD